MKTKIAVYTSTRAEYGLLRPLIGRLVKSNNFEVRIFVTGTHFSEKFGKTITEIEKDFAANIFYRVVHKLEESVSTKALPIMADALAKYADALASEPVELALVLGDRYEALCFGLACASLNIPIVHLHGGELTFGAIDDKFRHCLTKLSEWHFVACEDYRKRVVQLGEHPTSVFNVGALGVDNALNLSLKTREQLNQELGWQLPDEFYLFTFHPETNSQDYGVEILKEFLNNVSNYLSSSNATLIMTGVNNDAGAVEIKNILQKFLQKNVNSVKYYESLGVINYLSLVKISTAVLGNSSSGILEAHSLKTPTVNVGTRQDGRVRESSVYDFVTLESLRDLNFDAIKRIKNKLVSSPQQSVFGDGSTSQKMITHLLEIVSELPLRRSKNKTFYDLN